MKNVSIDRLDIRFKGLSPHLARSAVAGLGAQVLRELAQGERVNAARGPIEVTDLAVAPVQVAREASPTTVRRAVTDAITRAVEAEILPAGPQIPEKP